MLEHIVKNGEDIKQIIDVYRISFDELKTANLHITDFKNIVPGTKIRIPLINDEIEQILDNTESFVMDYYPKISTEIIEDKKKATEEISKKETTYQRGRAYPGIMPPKYFNNKNKWENQ